MKEKEKGKVLEELGSSEPSSHKEEETLSKVYEVGVEIIKRVRDVVEEQALIKASEWAMSMIALGKNPTLDDFLREKARWREILYVKLENYFSEVKQI